VARHHLECRPAEIASRLFRTEGQPGAIEGNKKAAPMRAPPIPKEILIPSSLPDWIILYPDCQVENCNSYCYSVVAASGKQYGKTGDVAATRADLAPEKSNF
jgi:hypothetical protein